MVRNTVARVDLDALKRNFIAIQRFVASEGGSKESEGPQLPTRKAPRVMAVVKANAYGHGAPRVALALEEVGADLFACADIEEAVVLRRAGVRSQILIFGALSV